MIVVAFATRIRTGQLGRGKQVKTLSVAAAVRHVGQVFELAGHTDPRRPHGGKDLQLAFSGLLKSYENVDPSTVSQLALSVKLFDISQATAGIIVIMCFFLLRVGEITCSQTRNPKHTVQFRRCDCAFWKKNNWMGV
jgi:hypothetical protein